ncbi:iron complex outermembrane recepter protein [Sphingobium faniae]|nr:iron complex outermembrane recepter protein [Sphingobium faniae]
MKFMDMKYRHVLLATTGVVSIILACPGAARAQGAGDAAGARAATSAAPAGEIVVTAQRRSEKLQDVPIAITAISAEMQTRAGITSFRDIQLLVPGAQFGDFVAIEQNVIRGIGTTTSAPPGLEPPVAVYYDGVYIARGIGSQESMSLYDPGTVQVLRGPQGVLYGRNATGGAIIVSSADPEDQFKGRIAGEYGNFDHVQLEGMINAPLSDELSLRVAGRYTDEDGYVKNRAVPGDRYYGGYKFGVRGKLKWSPSDSFTAVLGVEHSVLRQKLGSLAAFNIDTCMLCGTAGYPADYGFYDTYQNVIPRFRLNYTQVSLNITADLGGATLTSVTGYRKDTFSGDTDSDGTPSDVFMFRTPAEGGKSYVQDLTLSGKVGSNIDYLVGMSGLYDKGYYVAQLAGSLWDAVAAPFGAYPTFRDDVTTKSLSVFAEASYSFGDLKATVGGRYNWDRRELDVNINPAAVAAFGGPPMSDSANVSFRSFTPRFVLAWDNGPTNIYYSYTRGFKAGGYNLPTPTVVDPVKPSKIFSHEIGIKQRVEDWGHVNLAVFYQKSSDLQVQQIDLLAGGSRTENAASSEAYGVELDGQISPAEGLSLGAMVAYLHSEYLKYPAASLSCYTPAAGLFSCPLNVKGSPTQRSPRWSLGGNISYNFPLGVAGWVGNLAGLARYTSAYDFYPAAGGPLGMDRQAGYTLVNISGYVSPDESRSLRVGFYVNNLLDRKYVSFRGTNAPFLQYQQPGRPRTYGVRVSKTF